MVDIDKKSEQLDMSEEPKETDRFEANGEIHPQVKYKDPHTFLCSTRWRMVAYIFLSFTLLYMHRVNLSLAVVCMVDTTHSDTSAAHINNSVTVTNYSNILLANSSDGISSPYIPPFSSNVSNNEEGEQDILTKNFDDESISNCGDIKENENKAWRPEIHWEKTEISLLLSSYFYGSLFTQIPAGSISDTFGGKHVITTAMLISTVCSLVTPICARTSIILMFVVRIAVGLAGGSVIPAGMSMLNSWAPPPERAFMISVVASGLLTGAIITYLTSGLLCAYGFDNGWASIFYIHGSITGLFTCLWFFEGYSLPTHHPRISKEELGHIESSKVHSTSERPKTPWKSILLSKPQWATFIAHFCFNWSFFTVLINVPLFLKEVLKFDVKSNGLYSALPYIFQIVSSLASGKLSGVVIKRKLLGHRTTRRLFTLVSQFGIAVCLLSAGYVSCEARYVAVMLLCFACIFAGASYGGFFANHAEYAGQFAGTAFGLTNAGGVISSIVASMMAGLLTPNGLQKEWQVVFYVAASVNIIGALSFTLCSEVYLQPWARNQTTITISLDQDNGEIKIDNNQEEQELRTFKKEVTASEQERPVNIQETTPLKDEICS